MFLWVILFKVILETGWERFEMRSGCWLWQVPGAIQAAEWLKVTCPA